MTKELNLNTGKIGEKIAKEFLIKKGYKILEKNVKSKFGEIDLVIQDGKELVIVEVRTKIGDWFGSPEESLNKKKLNKLWLNAQGYVNKIKWNGRYRIDAVCIVLKESDRKTVERLEHYQNIWM